MKSKIISRKQLLTVSLVFALGLAVFVNWYYTKPNPNTAEPEVSSQANLGDAQYVNSDSVKQETDYFETAEINRKKAHDTAKEHLSNIINDSKTDNDTKELARTKLTNISEQIKLENDIQSLITAQIGNNCLVTYDDDSIEVILPKGVVDENVVLKIKDIIISKTSLSGDKITIIEAK